MGHCELFEVIATLVISFLYPKPPSPPRCYNWDARPEARRQNRFEKLVQSSGYYSRVRVETTGKS